MPPPDSLEPDGRSGRRVVRQAGFATEFSCAIADDGIYDQYVVHVAAQVHVVGIAIYSVWAVRRLYLEHFGTWPGPQSSSHPYERLMEFNDAEHCSCGRPGRRYGACCKAADHRKSPIVSAVNFVLGTNFELRAPPRALLPLLFQYQGANCPPLIATLAGDTAAASAVSK